MASSFPDPFNTARSALEQLTINFNDARRHKRRQIIGRSIKLTEEEIVISVGEALSSLKELNCCCFVKLSLGLSWKGHVDNVEICVFCPLNPLFEWSLLDASLRPVPGTLAFNNVEGSIHSQSHDWVASVRAGCQHNDGVKTIESHDWEEITRANVTLVVIIFLNCSLFKCNSHSVI